MKKRVGRKAPHGLRHFAGRKSKLRGVWHINPKSRVKESKKRYSRPAERKKVRDIVRRVDWFGDE